MKGKAAYMSPEQGLGDPLDRRSDLFAVGAVLFECVAGRRMWTGATEMQVLRQLALETPPRLTEVRADAPEPLADLIERLVSKDRASRPETAREVADALRAIAGGAGRADLARLMGELFADRAREKRAQLVRAFEARAPAEVEALRESLVAVPAANEAAPKPRPRTRGITLWAAGGLALIALTAAGWPVSKSSIASTWA